MRSSHRFVPARIPSGDWSPDRLALRRFATVPGLGSIAAVMALIALTLALAGPAAPATAAVAAVPLSQLEIDKTVDQVTAVAGDTLTYTVTVKNTGTVDATNVAAADHLPVDLTFASATGGGTLSGTTVGWTIPTVAAGTSQSFTVVATVDDPVPAEGLVNSFGITNPAGFNAPVVDHPCQADASKSCAATVILPNPGIVLVKKTNGQIATGPPGPVVKVGSAVSWTYDVTNSGNTWLASTSVVDVDGNGLPVVVTCPPGLVAPGATMECTAAGRAIAGQYSNTATATGRAVTSQGVLYIRVTPPTASDSSWYFGGTSQLEIDKTVDKASAVAGDTLTYTVTVKNSGDADATNVVASDQLPAGVTFASATGGGTLSGSTVGWTIPTVASGTSQSFTVAATVDPNAPAGTLVNSFGITDPAGFDPPVVDHACAGDATRSCASTVIGPVPAIALVKNTDGQHVTTEPGVVVNAGDPVSWTYDVTNTGNTPLAAPAVSDVDDSGNPVPVTCPTGTLAIGATIECTASGTAIAGQYTNTATATGTPADGQGTPLVGVNAPTATDSSGYFGQIDQLEIDKIVDKPTATNGDLLTYQVLVKNVSADLRADFDAINVAATDTLPSGVTFVSATAGGTLSGSAIHWTIADLPPTGEAVFTVVVKVDDTAPAGTLTNSFGVTTPDGFVPPVVDDPCTADPTRSCAVTTTSFTPHPSMAVHKLVESSEGSGQWIEADSSDGKAGTYNPGQIVHWRIQVKNSGNIPLTAILVTDPLAPTCTNPIKALAVGEQLEETCFSTAGSPGVMVNTATASVQAKGVTVTATDTAKVVVKAVPNPPPPPPVRPTGGGVLAFTGLNLDGVLGSALSLVAIGGALLLGARRRRPATS